MSLVVFLEKEMATHSWKNTKDGGVRWAIVHGFSKSWGYSGGTNIFIFTFR